jgi:hypothetical protein
MNDPKKTWVWVGVAVVIIAAGVWVFSLVNPGTQSSAPQGTSNPVPVYAPQGQLIPEFPKNLILDNNAVISGSYSIGYASTTNQYTAQYDSSSTVSALFKEYQSFLPQNGWTINGTLTSSPYYDLIAASQSNSQLQVLINTQTAGSQVVITYLVK